MRFVAEHAHLVAPHDYDVPKKRQLLPASSRSMEETVKEVVDLLTAVLNHTTTLGVVGQSDILLKTEDLMRTKESFIPVAIQAFILVYFYENRLTDMWRLYVEFLRSGNKTALLPRVAECVAQALNFASNTAAQRPIPSETEMPQEATVVAKNTPPANMLRTDSGSSGTWKNHLLPVDTNSKSNRDIAFQFHRNIRYVLKYHGAKSSCHPPSPDRWQKAQEIVAEMTDKYGLTPMEATYNVLLDRAPTSRDICATLEHMKNYNVPVNKRICAAASRSFKRLGDAAAAEKVEAFARTEVQQ